MLSYFKLLYLNMFTGHSIGFLSQCTWPRRYNALWCFINYYAPALMGLGWLGKFFFLGESSPSAGYLWPS